MSIPPKPIAARLEDIEAKMDEIIRSNEELITTNLQAGIKFDNIDMKMIKSEINEEIISAINKIKLVPFEWIELFIYCNKNDLSPEMMMELAKAMNYDF